MFPIWSLYLEQRFMSYNPQGVFQSPHTQTLPPQILIPTLGGAQHESVSLTKTHPQARNINVDRHSQILPNTQHLAS